MIGWNLAALHSVHHFLLVRFLSNNVDGGGDGIFFFLEVYTLAERF